MSVGIHFGLPGVLRGAASYTPTGPVRKIDAMLVARRVGRSQSVRPNRWVRLSKPLRVAITSRTVGLRAMVRLTTPEGTQSP